MAKNKQQKYEYIEIIDHDHELAEAVNLFYNRQREAYSTWSKKQLVLDRRALESYEIFIYAISIHPEQRLYKVLKPTRKENLQRIMYLIEYWILKIVELSDAGYVNPLIATIAIAGIGYDQRLATSLLCESYKNGLISFRK